MVHHYDIPKGGSSRRRQPTGVDDYCKRLRECALELGDVQKATATPSRDGEVVRLRYHGKAPESVVYAALNFNEKLGRPQGVELMVYKGKGS